MWIVDDIDRLALIWIALAVVLFPVQLFITAPYGRHVRDGWGPVVPSRLGWIVMEAVSPLVFLALYIAFGAAGGSAAWLLVGLWIVHYANRTLIYPLRTRSARPMPLAIVGSAIMFNVVNAGLNGAWLGAFGDTLPSGWFADPRFLLGLVVFGSGAAINLWADNRLLALRRQQSDRGYGVPRGGLFERISCPNHFGEIVEWTGFAILCWSLPALSFAIWTAANLIPRALSHHAWYRRTFADYPHRRRAVLPYLL